MSDVQHAPVVAKTPPAPQPTTATPAPGTAAPGPSNVDAEKQATLARAVGAITTEWKTVCGALLSPGKPTEPSPDKFRAAAYPLIARLDGSGQTGLIGVKLAFSVLDDRKEWTTALAAAEADAQQDAMHRGVIHNGLEDLVHGGDIQFNSQRIIGHFQMTSDGGRTWWQGQEALPWTGALAAYLGNKQLLETHVGYSGIPMFEAMYSGQADLRANLIRPLLLLLKTGAIEARPGDTGPAMPPSPTDQQKSAWDHQALELRKKVEPHLPQLGATKIDRLGGHERHELLSAVSDAPLEVRDRLALDTTFMRRVALLGELMKLQNDTQPGGQSLFRALDPVEALFDDVSGRSDITAGKQYIGTRPKTGAERFDRIAGYMAMHVKPDDQPLRMRVVSHPGMLDSLEDTQKANLWRFATRGTMQPGIEDRLYPAVKSGDATGAARVLLSASGEDRASISKLQADVLFRSAIATDAMRQQVALDGVAVRPYDLVLVMWGQRPGSTKDLGQTGVVEDDPNADQAPLNFEDRRKLDGMYNGSVDVLQNDLSAADAWLFAGARTSDSDVVAHLEHFATQCASKDYVGLIRRAGTPPGQELATRYNAKTGKSIQTLIKKGCGEDARRTAERILNITVDSASLGTVDGTGARAGDRGPGALVTLEQALRETTVDPSGGDTISQRVHAAAHELKEELHPGWFSHVDPTHAQAIFGLLDAQLDMPGSSRLDEVKRLTGRKVYTIELLQNAYMEIDGSLAETIANKAREKDVPAILSRLGLDAGAIATRAKATADAAAKPTDPKAAAREDADQKYGAAAKSLFEQLSALSPGADPTLFMMSRASRAMYEHLPGAGGGGEAAPDAQAGAGVVVATNAIDYYRVKYGLTPENHAVQIARAFRKWDAVKDSAQNPMQQYGTGVDHNRNETTPQEVAGWLGVPVELVAGAVKAPPQTEVPVVDDTNRMLVKPDFDAATATSIANQMWKMLHEGGEVHLIETTLYGMYNPEEQRLIRLAFRQLSGGIDWQFYVQQAKYLSDKSVADDTTSVRHGDNAQTMVGGEGTAAGQQVTGGNTVVKVVANDGELDALNEVATKGNLDICAQIRSSLSHDHVKDIFRIVDRATDDQCRKVLGDQQLMDQLQSKLDKYAWDRVYRTLSGQDDLAVRLESRSHGDYDSGWSKFWGSTDKEGMKDEVHAYVERMREKFLREAAADAGHKAGPTQEDAMAAELRLREACRGLAANPEVNAILESELSGAARETTRGLIIGAGKDSNVATVAGNGSDDDTLAEIKRMPQRERAGRIADPEYMARLQKQLSAANFQVAVSLLESTAKDGPQGAPSEVQDHLGDLIKDAGKERPDDDDVLRDLAQLTQAEHARLIADPAMTAKVMAAFVYSSDNKRAIAAQICGYDAVAKEDALVRNTSAMAQGRIIPGPEQQRLAFLVDNAIARVKQGNDMSWNRLLAQLVEVYKMDFTPHWHDPNANAVTAKDPSAPPDPKAAQEAQEDAAASAAIESQLREQVWAAVETDVAENHRDVARQAVLHEPGGDPSALRVAEQEGHVTTDRDGIADAITNASDDLLIESWTSIAQPKPDGGGTLATAYEQYVQARTAAGGEKKESSPQQEALHAAKLHFMGYVITESEDFEQDVLKHVSGWFDDDKSTQATADGKPDLTKARDNDHYNKVVKILRDRIPMLPPDKIAAKLGATDPADVALIDNPNRRVETTVHTETDEYLRKFGTVGGGMRVANAERATVNDTMERLGQESDTALTKTDKDGQYGVASAEDAAKVQKTAGDLERAMREFSTARAKIAMIAAAIVSTIVAVLVTVLTGGAGAGLGYMLVAGAITGAAAAAGSELTKSAIQGSDYDKSGALLNIAEGALTGMVFAGTMKIAEGAMDGLFGAKELAEQGAAMSKAVRTWPAAFKDFGMGTLRSGSEMVLAQGMNEAIMTGLAPLDPSLWVHGWNEGVYNSRHVVREKMSEFGDHMVSAAVTGVLMHGAGTALSAGKKGLGINPEEIIPTGPQYKKVESTLQRVFDAQRIKNNAARYLQVDSMLVQAFASFVSNRITGGPIDWDNVPDSLFQEFIGAVQGMSTQVISGYYRPWQKAAAHGESPRAATREEELKQRGHELTGSERENYKALNPDDGKAPAVSIDDYIAARKEIIDARLLDWQTKNRPLTAEERAAFEAWCRDAKDTADLQKRAATSPLEVEAVKAVAPKGTAAKPADATAQQAPATGPGGESMADRAAKLTGTVHAIEGTGFDGSARGESAPQKVAADIARALPAIMAGFEPGTIKQVGERMIVVQIGASTLTIELTTMTATSNEPGGFRFIGPDMARIEISDQLRDQEVERTLADLLAQTRAAREAQLAGKPMVTESALGADAKGKQLSVEDRGRVGQLKDLLGQLDAARADEAAKQDPAAADRLGKEIDDVLRAMKLDGPEAVKHLEELGAGLTQAQQNALVVRLDAPRREAAAKDLGPHPGTELHNHFLGVVDPTSFADATKTQEAAKAKAEGRAPSTKSGWELTLDQIAGMDKLAHSKDGKAVERGQAFDKRGTSGDAVAIAKLAQRVVEGKAPDLGHAPDWLTKGAAELDALTRKAEAAEGSEQQRLASEVEKKKAEIAEHAVRTALTATEETDFNSSYEVRDELIKSQMGGPQASDLRVELAREQAKPGGGDPARIKGLQKQIEGAAYEDFARQTMRALVKDGLTYNEQSNSIKKLNEKFTKTVMDRVIWEESAKMLAAHEITEAQVIQLRELTMTLTGFFGEEETRADEGGDARNKDRKAGKGQFGDKGWSNPEPAKGEQLGQKEQIKEQLETRADVMGVDIAGPETARFDGIGQGRFTELYELIRQAAIKRNRPLVLRPHVGEGFTDTEAGKEFNKNESKRKGEEAAHYDRSRKNLQALLDSLQELKNAGKLDPEHVVVRFGHATHADAAQVEQMASLGIVAEVNLESNVATGSLEQRDPETGKSLETETFEDHALLGYVLIGNETILSTDAHSVMGTNMTEEYGRAKRIIEEFLAGKSYVEVTEARAKGRGQREVVNKGTPYERVEYRLHVGDLDATELEKFTKGYEKLNEFGRDYQKKVAQQDKGDKLLWKEAFELSAQQQRTPGEDLHLKNLVERLAMSGSTLDDQSLQFAASMDKAGADRIRAEASHISEEQSKDKKDPSDPSSTSGASGAPAPVTPPKEPPKPVEPIAQPAKPTAANDRGTGAVRVPSSPQEQADAQQLGKSVDTLKQKFGDENARFDAKLVGPPKDRPVLEQSASDALIGLPTTAISATATAADAEKMMQTNGIPRWGALTAKERAHETAFANEVEKHLPEMVEEFYARSLGSDGVYTFEVDGAKKLYEKYGTQKAPQTPEQLDVRATANHALHPTAVAIARLAFLKALDAMSTMDPKDPRKAVFVTNGGCAAGKGSLTDIVKGAAGGKFNFGAVWDAAGEGDSQENGWILQAARSRGIKVTYGFVESDPMLTYNGVLERAQGTGRIVDPVTFSRSYVRGQENMRAFLESKEYQDAVARGEVEAVGVYTGKFDMATKTFPDKRMLGDNGKITAKDINKAPDEGVVTSKAIDIFHEWLKKQASEGKPTDHWHEGGAINPMKFHPEASVKPTEDMQAEAEAKNTPTKGTAAPIGEFRGDARPAEQPDLTTEHLREVVLNNLRLVLPDDFVWIEGLVFDGPNGQRVAIEVGPTRGNSTSSYDGGTISVSPRAADVDIVRAVAHELEEIKAELGGVRGDDSDRPNEVSKHLRGRFAELRTLLAQLDAAQQRPNDRMIVGQDTQLPRLRAALEDLLVELGARDPDHAEKLLELLNKWDPAVAQRLVLQLENISRPVAGHEQTRERFSEESTKYLSDLKGQATGPNTDAMVETEALALGASMNREEGFRLFDPLFSDDALMAQRGLGAARAKFDAALAAMRDVMNDPTLSDEVRTARLEAAITGLKATSEFVPVTSKLSDADFKSMHDAAKAIRRGADQSGIMVMDDATRMVRVGPSPISSGASPSEMTFDQFVAMVDKANQGAAQNGLDIEYVIIVHRSVGGEGHGQSMIEVLSRPKPRYRVAAEQMATKGDAPAQLPDSKGKYVVDVGVGRSAAGSETSGHEPDKTTLLQTELIDDAELGQTRRDMGVLDPAPVASKGGVLMYCDFLTSAEVIAGQDGVTKILLNNISAHLDPGQYPAIAAQLAKAMAKGGEIDVQWDMRDERGKTDSDGKIVENGNRGHIQGTLLLDAFKKLGIAVTSTTPPPIKYQYSIDAARGNTPKKNDFTNPDPQYRMVIKFP